ncbi:hypothetical protein [Picosynechococcus sp. PCC 73109]|uniref:hypothetical protein n=1 Tax=Picosynechococcus sp. PCC 73109 TaxID=374982 RepID=UPI00074593D2|nr:hypothetical protein [Picosynechococcus sp. PCC 73109]AMA09387.1 hypothetical protein AWQ23_08690 [Picosynechococcus sp. PCC 73109]
MNLLNTETLWVLISGSDEERFLSDIQFAISCLEFRGIDHQNILAFIDEPSGMGVVNAYGFPPSISIFPTSNIGSELNTRVNTNLVVVVTGHGSQNGIAAINDISPYFLLTNIKQLNVKSCLIVLGQCFAGTFNFLEARSSNQSIGNTTPEICIIGATSLNVSISSLINFSGIVDFKHFQPQAPWLANLFLFYFMLHVAMPKDTDGDGEITVMDTYKAAGIGANRHLISAKSQAFLEMHKILIQSGLGQGQKQQSLITQLDQQAQQDYLANCEIVLTAQTPWILHANFARQLKL